MTIKAYIPLALGLALVVLGSTLLILDPPRIKTYLTTEKIPYTVFDELPPGWHNYTTAYTAGKGKLHVEMPGYNITKANIILPKIENCTSGELTLDIYSENEFHATDDGYINITLLAEQGNKTILVDSVYIPINASDLAVTGTPSTVTLTSGTSYIVTVKPGETATEFPELPTSYEVKGVRGLLDAVVYKTSEDAIVVKMGTWKQSIPIPLNTTAILLSANGNVQGTLHVWMRAQYLCTVTYYLDKPLFRPYTAYHEINVVDHYLELGSLVQAAALNSVGLALMLISCFMISRKSR